mgnify:FL=1
MKSNLIFYIIGCEQDKKIETLQTCGCQCLSRHTQTTKDTLLSKTITGVLFLALGFYVIYDLRESAQSRERINYLSLRVENLEKLQTEYQSDVSFSKWLCSLATELSVASLYQRGPTPLCLYTDERHHPLRVCVESFVACVSMRIHYKSFLTYHKSNAWHGQHDRWMKTYHWTKFVSIFYFCNYHAVKLSLIT